MHSLGHQLLGSLKEPTRALAQRANVSPATISRIRSGTTARVGEDVAAKLAVLGIPVGAWTMPAQADDSDNGQHDGANRYADWPMLDPSAEVNRLERLCQDLEQKGRARDLVAACAELRLAKRAAREAVLEARSREAIEADQIVFALRTILSNPAFYGLCSVVGDIFDRATVGGWDPHQHPLTPDDVEVELSNRVEWFKERLASSERRLAAYRQGCPFDDLPEETPSGDKAQWGLATK